MKRCLLVISLLMLANVLLAQKKPDEIPLLKYLQANFDSIVILNTANFNWDSNDNLSIICKSEKGIAFFTYKDPSSNYTYSRAFPQEIIRKFYWQSYTFQHTMPDTNQYFLPLNTFADTENLWACFQTNKIWTILDDTIEGEGCKSNGCSISDGSYYYFTLITKKEIKVLKFYAPVYYEKCCGGRAGRQNIIKVLSQICTVFGCFLEKI